MASHKSVDWSECQLIESKLGIQSGAPVLRGTRMPVDAIVDNFDYGVSIAEISDQFEISQDCIQAIVKYAESHRVAHPV